MLTKGKRAYQIDIFNLSNQLHEFEFHIDNELLAWDEHSELSEGNGTCKVKLQKSETMMDLLFLIDVSVELTCDRSLEKFDHQINIEEDVIVKFGEADDDSHEEYTIIKKDTPSIFVDGLIYEFINLAVPMKKLHPKHKDQDSPDMIYSTQVEEKAEEIVDPRWEALKKLKDQ